MTDIKAEVRPDYTTLQGYLAQLHKITTLGLVHDQEARNYQNQLKIIIERLNALTGNDYSEFEVTAEVGRDYDNQPYVSFNLNIYAFKMSGLISKLYGQFFYDERNPLDGSPSTVITSNQNQSQQVDINLRLDVSSRIDEKLKQAEDPTEKNLFISNESRTQYS